MKNIQNISIKVENPNLRQKIIILYTNILLSIVLWFLKSNNDEFRATVVNIAKTAYARIKSCA